MLTTPSREAGSALSVQSVRSLPTWVTPSPTLGLPPGPSSPRLATTEPLVEMAISDGGYASDDSTIMDYDIPIPAPPVHDYVGFIDWLSENISTYLSESFHYFL